MTRSSPGLFDLWWERNRGVRPFDRGVAWNPNRSIRYTNMERRRDRYKDKERERENARGAHAECRATAYVERRGVGRVTRSHGVRCVKWSTIPPPVIICILSRVAISPTGGRTGAAWRGSVRRARAVHRWHGVAARHDRQLLSPGLAQSEHVDPPRVTIPGCTACVSIVHPSTASSSSSFPLFLPFLSLISRALSVVPHGPLILRFGFGASTYYIGHRSSIHGAQMSNAIFEGGIWRESVYKVERDFIIGHYNVNWQPFQRCMRWHLVRRSVNIHRNVLLGLFMSLTFGKIINHFRDISWLENGNKQNNN